MRMLLFDLDSPILDVSERYYQVHKTCAKSFSLNLLSKLEYWEQKRNKVREEKILNLNYDSAQFQQYQELRKKLIELPKYLALDNLQDVVYDILKNLKQRFQLILITMRRERVYLTNQINKFNITNYFSDIINNTEKLEGVKAKQETLTSYLQNNKVDIEGIIGDYESEIMLLQYFKIIP